MYANFDKVQTGPIVALHYIAFYFHATLNSFHQISKHVYRKKVSDTIQHVDVVADFIYTLLLLYVVCVFVYRRIPFEKYTL